MNRKFRICAALFSSVQLTVHVQHVHSPRMNELWLRIARSTYNNEALFQTWFGRPIKGQCYIAVSSLPSLRSTDSREYKHGNEKYYTFRLGEFGNGCPVRVRGGMAPVEGPE